jgi:glycosidase
MDEFKKLVNAIHSKGMKCIMDVVYNHTSPDSWLVKNHPEWFYKKSDGAFGNKVGEWLDVIDLDFRHQELWGYLIDTLKQWAEIVDGFRCDVAPLIPLEFWLRARKEVGAVRPDCFWLSESVEPLFTLDNRARKMISLSDSEIFQAFDVCYEYDIFESFNLYLEGKIPLEDYVKQINMQEYIYPDNYVKLRYLENHDRPRARFIIPDEQQLRNWTAFIYFQKGMTLIFAGQETGNTFRPSLFDKDVVQWETGYDISDYLARLYDIKKNAVFTDSTYSVSAPGNDVVVAVHKSGKKQMIGIFSMKGKTSLVRVDVPEGTYRNQVDDNMVCVEGGLLTCKGEPIIFEEAGKEET